MADANDRSPDDDQDEPSLLSLIRPRIVTSYTEPEDIIGPLRPTNPAEPWWRLWRHRGNR